jgi:hypothetical protein
LTSFLAPRGFIAFELDDVLLLTALVRREVTFRLASGLKFSERENELLRLLQTGASVEMRRSDTGTCGTVAEERMVYSTEQAAERLGFSARNLQKYAGRYGGRKAGKAWVFDADEIELARSARVRDGRLRGNVGEVGA